MSKKEEQGTERSIRESLLELLAKLVALIAGRHIYIKCKVYLLEIFSWQNPNLEKRLDVSRQKIEFPSPYRSCPPLLGPCGLKNILYHDHIESDNITTYHLVRSRANIFCPQAGNSE